MIYCDTSSLVKLYITEKYSRWVKETFEEQELVTCKVALPEMFSALNRRFNEGTLTESQLNTLKDNIFQDWDRGFSFLNKN
ncbi:type II toxin-antitoxin system VapC family toxin [Candidatus Marithioploca araucensis]|uniref:Type II toxin-antitoxin system VapC family toxin n=1 Tax=Candidatus Marithioploca araucensis TaxID=70273 RepID=A0ABT7VT30_9GAMM|nr:type II toxin-antitoxin system VapC family toxin [Candidatus Marithioploca araucensis]